jgi:hypothetical protein
VYLRGKVTVVQDPATAAAGWSFLGGEGASPIGSAASLINKVTILAGGAVVEQIDQVGHLHNLLLTHTNASYCAYDAAVKELRGLTGGAANLAGTTVEFAVPVFSGLLNSGHHFPAFLLPQMNINFDLQPVLQALRATTATQSNPTAYTVSEAYLAYEALEPDQAYIQAIRAKLNETDKAGNPKAFGINYLSYMHQQLDGNTGTIMALQGLSSSSLRAVLYTNFINAAGANSAATDGNYNDAITVVAGADTDLFVDGRQINQVRYNSLPVVYAELERALGRLGDPTINSELVGATVPLKQASYADCRYLAGVNCTRVDDANLSFSGTPVNQLQLRVSGRAPAASTFHMWACVDRVIMIDRSGAARVVN